MNHSFLVAHPGLSQALENTVSGGSASSEITRRTFLKRTGGATVASLVAWNVLQTRSRGAENEGGGSGESGGFDDPVGASELISFECFSPEGDQLAPPHNDDAWQYQETIEQKSAPFDVFLRKKSNDAIDKTVTCKWVVEITIKINHGHYTTEIPRFHKTCAIIEFGIKAALYDIGEEPDVRIGDLFEGPKARLYTNLYLMKKNTTPDLQNVGRPPTWVYAIAHSTSNVAVPAEPVNGVTMTIQQAYTHPKNPSDPKSIFPEVKSYDFKAIYPATKTAIGAYLEPSDDQKVDVSSFLSAPEGPARKAANGEIWQVGFQILKMAKNRNDHLCAYLMDHDNTPHEPE